MSSLVAKIKYANINSNWMHEIIAGRKKTTKIFKRNSMAWFPEQYIGWIGFGNHGQKTSIMYG